VADAHQQHWSDGGFEVIAMSLVVLMICWLAVLKLADHGLPGAMRRPG
jgi:hypothetical protein